MLLRQITGTQVLLAFRASEVSSIDNKCLNVSSEIEEILANIKPDDFTRQWETPGSQWVKQRDDRYTNSMQMNSLWGLLALLVLPKESRKGQELMERNTQLCSI